MASYEKRGKKIRAVVSVNDHGTRRKVSRTFDKKREAVAWTATMESDKYQNKSIVASQMTFAEYFEMWMNREKIQNVRKSTFASYKTSLLLIKKYFKDAKLSELNYPYLQKELDKYCETHTHSTAILFCAKIKASLKDALFDGYIIKDIFSKLKPHGKDGKHNKKVLSAREFEVLRERLYFDLDNKEIDMASLVILIAVETGMRLGEILALTPRDISISFNTISVSKSFSGTTHLITEPKTKNSKRIIEIPTTLSHELSKFITDPTSGNRIMTFSYTPIRHKLSELLTDLNIEYIVFHGLRHSHASYLLYKGISINYVSARLGHANTAITQKVYAHMLKEEKNREGQKAMTVLNEMSPNVPSTKKNAVK